MTTFVLAHRKISSPIPGEGLRVVRERSASLLGNPMLAVTLAVGIAVGAGAYIAMLFVSFDLGVRLHHASAAYERQGEELKRMEVIGQEREAQFSMRHNAFLEGMERIVTLKYLTPERTAVSELPRTTP